MNVGEILLALGAVAALGAAFLRFWGMRTTDKFMIRYSTMLSIVTFVIVTLSLFFLIYLFASSDMSYLYVWSYSSTDLSLMYKLSGVWAGASGSFLLWVWFMALVLAVEVMIEPKRKHLTPRFHSVFQIILSGVIFVFMLMLINMDLFAKTADWRLIAYRNGYGMSLALQTPEMVIHPPVVFAGYAFCVAALAASIAYFVREDANWFTVALPWSRLAWLFLTLGIGIGAVWAYYVLGWGGYWAWDPVETASLLPWLVMTAFLHTQVRHARKGEYAVLSPVLGVLSFASVVFATFATRAGGVWSGSVHTFDSGNSTSSGLARLGQLLGDDMTVLGLFTMLVALFALAMFIMFSLSKKTRKPEEEVPERISGYISDRNNMLLTVLLLAATAGVMLLLMFKNTNTSQAANYAEFNQKMSVFFVGTMVAMSICLIWKMLGKEKALWLGIIIIIASAVFGIAALMTDFTNGLVAFSAPSYAVAVGASVVKLFRSKVEGSRRKTLQKMSPHLIHLGVALILLSFVVSSNLQHYPEVGGSTAKSGVTLQLGGEVSVGDYTVRLVDLNASGTDFSSGAYAVNEKRSATVDILQDGKVVREGLVLTNLYGTSMYGRPQVMDVEVYVLKSVISDLYLDYQWKNSTSAVVEVKTLPMMNVLWTGLGLLAIGLVVRAFAWQQEPRELPARKGRTSEKPEGGPVPQTEEKDYEAIVEEELRKFKEKSKK